MKHVELINCIIQAEQRAQQIAGEAREKKRLLRQELQETAAGIRESYFQRARDRVEEVRRREDKLTAERLAALAVARDRDLEIMERTFAQHRDEWVEQLFSMIVGR